MPTNSETIDTQDLPTGPSVSSAAAGVAVRALGYTNTHGPVERTDFKLRQQAAAIDRLCVQRGWTLVELVREVQPERGRRPARPSFEYALDRLRTGHAKCLVVTELSHLSSSVADLGDTLDALDKAGVRLVVLDPGVDTATLAGRAALRVVKSVSGWERRRRAQMTSAARAKVTTPSVIDPKLKRRVQRMRAAGMTLQGIVDVLNDERVPTARGGAEWRPSSVQAALGYRRPRG